MIHRPSFAKINLHLQVVGRREDGYHELRTLFQTIDLADRIGLERRPGGAIELEVEGADLPTGTGNLVHRAAAAFLDRWGGGDGVRLELTKRIPVGGGLGGGSSNAAAVLLALREMYGEPRSLASLWPLARALGADVPYFLVGGTALGFGRGDEVVALPDLPSRALWLALPRLEISTPEVFAALGSLTGDPLEPTIMASVQGERVRWDDLSMAVNDLETVVFERWPALRTVQSVLLESGAEFARLSGSGTVLFAGGDGFDPELAAGALPDGCALRPVSTLSRDDLARSKDGSGMA